MITLESPYLTRKQAAVYLNVSESWLANGGRISGPRYSKFGNATRYHLDDLKSWARQQQVSR